MMWTKLRMFTAIVLALCVAVAIPEAPGSQKDRLRQLMMDKLRDSQELIQGIALGDFAKITKSAEDLLRLSRTAEWLANRTPRFEAHSIDFQRAAEEVIRKAKAKNLDGVVLAYQDLTMACVRCHVYIRETRDARAPNIDPAVLTAFRHPRTAE